MSRPPSRIGVAGEAEPPNRRPRTAAAMIRTPVQALLNNANHTQTTTPRNSTDKPNSKVSFTPVSGTTRPSSSASSSSSTVPRPSVPTDGSSSSSLPRPIRHSLSSLLGHVHRSWLLNPYGERVPISSLHVRRPIVGLYFTASWSLPCRVFTSQLAKVYMELDGQQEKTPFEIVAVTFEHAAPTTPPPNASEAPLRADVASTLIDFGLHLPEEDRHTRRRLTSLFHVKRIPSLILLDPSGDVVSLDGVPLLTQRGSSGYPFHPDAIIDSEARRRFEAEVVEIFAHIDRKKRLQIDAQDLESCLISGGTLPIGAVRSCAAQMLSDIGSPSLSSTFTTSAGGGSNDLSRSSGTISVRGVNPSSVSLAEWKTFFHRTIAKHGAEYPLHGLRRMVGLAESKIDHVPHGREVDTAIPGLYHTLEADIDERHRRMLDQLARGSAPSTPTHSRSTPHTAPSRSGAASPTEGVYDALPTSPNVSPRKVK